MSDRVESTIIRTLPGSEPRERSSDFPGGLRITAAAATPTARAARIRVIGPRYDGPRPGKVARHFHRGLPADTMPAAEVGYSPDSQSPARLVWCETMFSAAKDMMSSRAAKAYANNLISRYGSVDELSIDSKRRRIEVVVQLNGEVSPIGVTIEKYQVVQEDGKTFIEVVDSSCTRPWLQAAMRDHLHGRKFAVPSWAAAAL